VFTDGIEALEFLQGHERYARRDTRDAPSVILLDIQ
jgi:CheY-like chemotaxis protein